MATPCCALHLRLPAAGLRGGKTASAAHDRRLRRKTPSRCRTSCSTARPARARPRRSLPSLASCSGRSHARARQGTASAVPGAMPPPVYLTTFFSTSRRQPIHAGARPRAQRFRRAWYLCRPRQGPCQAQSVAGIAARHTSPSHVGSFSAQIKSFASTTTSTKTHGGQTCPRACLISWMAT